MRRSSQPEPPYVAVVGDASSALVRAALAGLEEEGVPSRVVERDAGVRGVEAAARAAVRSPLEVGLVIGEDVACLTHAKFLDGAAIEECGAPSVADARRLGHNAARVVCGVPLARQS